MIGGRAMKEALRFGTHVALWPFERAALARAQTGLRHPALFIVGPPRSGTTLLYQLLVQRFRTSYLSNLAATLYRTPIAATRLGRAILPTHESDYRSTYGRVSGPMAPSEAGSVWGRWFSSGLDAVRGGAADEPDAARREQMGRTIAGIEASFGVPFVSKNVYHSIRIRPLAKAFPSALFLVMERDRCETAVSILHARRTRSRSVDAWWSVPPREVGQLQGASLLEQVAGQVHYIERDIAEDLDRLGFERGLAVSYHELCTDPEAVLAGIAAFAARSGCMLQERGVVPERFEPGGGKKDVTADEIERLRAIFERWRARDSVEAG